MMSREEVLKIASLARLSLTEEEVAFYQKQLGRVLEYIRDLNQLQTPKDAFVQHVPTDALGFRVDEAVSFLAHDEMMKNAPAMEENCFLLPTIVEHS